MEYSKIRDVCIEIPDYKFKHSPSALSDSKKDPRFVGRDKFFEQFKLALSPKDNNRGAYLVTGYRGMGKTSAVTEALKKLKSDFGKDKIKVIELSLSQDDVDEIDLLRQITKLLLENWITLHPLDRKGETHLKTLFSKIFVLISVILLVTVFLLNSQFFWDLLEKVTDFGVAVFFSGVLLIGSLISWVYADREKVNFETKVKKRAAHDVIKKRLLHLNDRLYAEVSRGLEVSQSQAANIGFKGFDFIKDSAPHVLSFQKDSKKSDIINYSAASYKEIEKELLIILKIIRKARDEGKLKIPYYIFVIDELDKVAPDYPADKEKHGSLRRVRTELITSLLSRMKNFITSAEGKFIFIGGRDMYDASLADIADREAFFSSIFNHVFNLNSFFKDSIQGKQGITEVSEGFLSQYLNYNEHSDKKYKLSTFIKKQQKNLEPREVVKLTVLLQSFIIFLTYRSNGSPKKIIELFEQFLISGTRFEKIDNTYSCLVVRCDPQDQIPLENKLFLRFSYIQQYEIGATASLYRPYLIVHSRHLKLLEDKLLYSSAFIVDHILKFHKNAFSWNNLEVIPDIILSSNNPNLRPYLQEIMDFFSKTHIRQTINAIYQYKFFSKTRNEIQYLSKISELSSAAFNFTLDESRHMKNYYQNILNQKREVYNRTNADIDNQYVHSIEYLNTVLGDLEYYDENYHRAILKYTDAIQSLRNLITNGKKISHHQTTLFVRKKLKVGLALEKLRSFDSSYSIYRSLTLQVGNLAPLNNSTEKEDKKGRVDKWDPPFRRMQLFVRPHISLLDIIEKQRVDGITFSNLRRNIFDYCNLLGLKKIFPFTAYCKIPYKDIFDSSDSVNTSSDNKRLQTLIYDYYSNVGGILFFKNKNFLRLHSLAFETLLVREKIIVDKLPKTLMNLLIQENENTVGNTKVETHNNILGNLYNFTKYQSYNDETASVDTKILENYSPSLSSYFYYRAALKNFILPYEENLIKIYSDISNKDAKIIENDFILALKLSLPEARIILNSTQKFILGNILSKIGDAALAIVSKYSAGDTDTKALLLFSDKQEKSIKNKSVEKYFKAKLLGNIKNGEGDKTHFFDINFPIYIYYLSAIFYQLSSRNYSYAFQYKKILYIIRDHIWSFKGQLEKTNSEIETIKATKEAAENISLKVIENTNNLSGGSSTAEYLKYQEILSGVENCEPQTLTSLSISQEVKEVLILVEQIKLRFNRILPENDRFETHSLLSKDDVISNIYVRLKEMNYQSEHNYARFSKKLSYRIKLSDEQFSLRIVTKLLLLLTNEGVKATSPESAAIEIKKTYKEITRLTLDSIFCLREAIKAIDVYNKGYIVTYSYLANLHLKLSVWCSVFAELLKIDESIEEELFKLFNDKDKVKLNQLYHLKLSKIMFNESIALHKQGKPYKALKSNMYFLEDDYNDNLTHFSASAERFNLNTGKINYKLDKIENQIAVAENIKYQNFFSDCTIPDDDNTMKISKEITEDLKTIYDQFKSNRVHNYSMSPKTYSLITKIIINESPINNTEYCQLREYIIETIRAINYSN